MFVRIFIVVAILAIVFAGFDRPIDGPRRFLLGAGPDGSIETRQAAMGLRIAIDLEARREGRRIAVLLDDWLYCYPETGEVFAVPRGYETDFASIPRGAHIAVNPFGNHAEAAVIHDWLYAVGETGQRKKADNIFRFAMKEQSVNRIKRNVMHRAVRMAGADAYGREDEWRFRSPRTLGPLPEPPFERPDSAVVDVIDCKDLSIETDRLLSRFADMVDS